MTAAAKRLKTMTAAVSTIVKTKTMKSTYHPCDKTQLRAKTHFLHGVFCSAFGMILLLLLLLGARSPVRPCSIVIARVLVALSWVAGLEPTLAVVTTRSLPSDVVL